MAGEKTIYIFSDGELKRSGNTLMLATAEKKRYVPVEAVREVLAFGEISVNKKALEFLSQHEILMHYFSYYGYYMGTFYPREHYNSGYMVLKQSEAYLDPARRLGLAQSFVHGAIENILRVLRYYANRGKQLESLIDRIQEMAEVATTVGAIPELMAAEGNIREQYYKAFDVILENDDFAFESRSRRPPQNALNALISFGNSLMYTTILSETYKTHLDPRIGYLHATNNRRFSLNLDIAEVFKPIIVDRLIFSLVGRKQIQRKSFDEKREGLLLKDKARETFVKSYDERLSQTIKHDGLKRNVSYRELMRLELYKLEKDLMGETPYKPFAARW